MKHLMKGMTEIEKQLHQLYDEMNRMIEEGDHAPANVMIEAKYKAVKGQFESGIQGMEQVAILDMLAQLRMILGKAEEVACLLSETKEVVDKFGSDSAQPLLDSVLEHMGSMYTSLGKPEEALPYYQRSLKIQEELHGKESEHLLSPTHAL
jgi:tetratricopeptide (TPR) repeat protein